MPDVAAPSVAEVPSTEPLEETMHVNASVELIGSAPSRYRGPILARRVPIANRCPDIKLPEPPEFAMPPTVLKYAACAGEDPDLFFPDASQASDNDTARAKAICARCPVRDECLKWAIDNQQIHGIWGGLDESERSGKEADAFGLRTNPEKRSPRRMSGRAPRDARKTKEGK
jgi:WhiB family transcriptional regulator, redox-sensing transcriptional regulator